MIEGSSVRKAEHPVDAVFIDRWSPRAMSGEGVGDDELMVLFEAARWAPSSYNNQPWRILYAHRDSAHWNVFFDLLSESNRAWAHRAGCLLLFISKTTFDHNGTASRTHSFDTGASWQNLALQGYLRGLVVHGMQGFDYDRARVELGIPAEFAIEMMAAVGRPGDAALLPESLQKAEIPKTRRSLETTVCEGPFALFDTDRTL